MNQNYNANAGLQKQQEAAGAGYGQIAGQQVAADYARPTAKSLLRQRVRDLRREAEELEALAKALPEELPQQANAALWAMLTSR